MGLFGTRIYGRDPFGGGHHDPIPVAIATGIGLRIGATEAIGYLQQFTYRVREILNGPSEAECTLISRDGFSPAVGQEFILTKGPARMFAGTIHERDVSFLTENNATIVQTLLRCVDWNEIATRRIVAEVYTNVTAGDIIRNIRGKYLAGDFIDAGIIQDGPTIEKAVYPYMTVQEVFNELSGRSGFHWRIDYQKRLHFFERTFYPSPVSINSSNAVFHDIRGTKSRNQYRNVQYIDGGVGVTDTRTETFRSDGTQKSWNVQFKVNDKPDSVTINGVDQTIGIRGVDTNQQVYWNKGETAIGLDDAQPIPAQNAIIIITYRGQYDTIGIVEDAAAIIERRIVQGGTGLYDAIERDDTLDGEAAVRDKALSLLRRYASIDETVTFDTYTDGIETGQLVTLTVPELGLTGDHLCTQIETDTLVFDRQRHRVTVTTGELKGTWQDFFSKIFSRTRRVNLRESEVLQEVTAVLDGVAVTDSITAILANLTEAEWGTDVFGQAEFGVQPWRILASDTIGFILTDKAQTDHPRVTDSLAVQLTDNGTKLP